MFKHAVTTDESGLLTR